MGESLQQIPRQLKIKLKSRSAIEEATPGKDREDLLGQELNAMESDGVPLDIVDIVECRTFFCIVPRLRSSASVNQSTTEAHGGLNPRRLAPMNSCVGCSAQTDSVRQTFYPKYAPM